MAPEQKPKEQRPLREPIELSPDTCPDTMAVCGFDHCVLGLTSKQLLVYDQDAMVEHLVARDGMTHKEAQEFFDYNIEGAYVGEYTPIFMTKK